jgi:mono/diheme cytochrome c family protein
MGWGGNIGPNLDGAHPPVTLAITRLTNGAGAMPSFKGTLTTAQIKCAATVVATLTKGGSTPADQAAACKGLA